MNRPFDAKWQEEALLEYTQIHKRLIPVLRRIIMSEQSLPEAKEAAKILLKELDAKK